MNKQKLAYRQCFERAGLSIKHVMQKWEPNLFCSIADLMVFRRS